MFNKMSKVTQGCVGLGAAISYFTRMGMVVLLPLIDNQDYDLAVESSGEIRKVQVKTTGYVDKRNKSSSFVVQLQKVRSNRKKNIIHKFEKNKIDYLFILTSTGDEYLIPSENIQAKNAISLCESYNQYKVSGK